MHFAIGNLTDYHQAGFDTTHWRKSTDGTQALCHAEMALTLMPADKLDIYAHNDETFLELLRSDVWTKDEYEVLDAPAE